MSSSSTEEGGSSGGGCGGTPFEQWQQVSFTGSPSPPLPPTPPSLLPTPTPSPLSLRLPSPMLLTSLTTPDPPATSTPTSPISFTPVSPVTSTPSSPAAAATEAADDDDDDEPFPSDLPDVAANSCAQAEQNDYLLTSGHLLQLKLSVLFNYPLTPPPNSPRYTCGDPFSTLSILSFFPFKPHLHRLGSLLPYYLRTSGHHLQLRLDVICNYPQSLSRELLNWPQDDPNSNDLTLTFFSF